MRPPAVPPARLAAGALPVVDAAPFEPVLELPLEPDGFAVPRLLVPGALGVFVELPTPMVSLPELFSLPAFAGSRSSRLRNFRQLSNSAASTIRYNWHGHRNECHGEVISLTRLKIDSPRWLGKIPARGGEFHL